jgi:hypothetical protein
MGYERIRFDSIRSLTFYKGEYTNGRRTDPIPQLVCDGDCRGYTPDVVRCTNAGGSGTEVDWECKAELPSYLRLGRVQVGCEGWSKAGDTNVLKGASVSQLREVHTDDIRLSLGSCSLNYRLTALPRDGDHRSTPHKSWLGGEYRLCHFRWVVLIHVSLDDIGSVLFGLVWIAILLFIVVSFLRSCLSSRGVNRTNEPFNRPAGGPGSGRYGSGDAPPPYTPAPGASPPGKPADGSTSQGWRPGVWSGLAAGAIGAQLARSLNNNNNQQPTQRDYDWDRYRQSDRRRGSSPFNDRSSNDRGEGSSTMRTSTGFGGSNVR